MEAVKPTSRMAARLADLPRSQLLEIAAAGCEASIEVKNRADAILAAHKPLAQRAVEGVLLSSDLLPPHLLAPLQLEDCAAAAVCSRWAEDWKATGEGWRRLRKVDFPQDLLPHWPYSMAVIPGDDEYIDELVVQSGSMAHILGRGMRKITSFKLPTSSGTIAASEEFLYVTGRGRIIPGRITSLTHDGIEVATWEDQKCIGRPVLGPDGLLFCMICNSADYGYDEIVALDAETLQPRHRFGHSTLYEACSMVVVGEELFVSNYDDDGLQVFSFTGEHRRSITGEWKRPLDLCFVKDRLYLIEDHDGNEVDEQGELIYPLVGRRIFVLSLQGDTLQVEQVCTHPDEGLRFVRLCYFDGNLLAAVRPRFEDDIVEVVSIYPVWRVP